MWGNRGFAEDFLDDFLDFGKKDNLDTDPKSEYNTEESREKRAFPGGMRI